MADNHRYRLISFNLCPFVQRSVIALNEKNVDYDIEYIDLANKPEWFLKISPRGLVPVLDLGDVQLFESAPIAEFIDESTDGALMPEDVVARAQHRAWINVGGDINGPAYRIMVGDEEATREAAKKAHQELARFENVLGDGPFFAGAAFSLVDATVAPPLQRLTWAERVEPLGVFDGLPKVQAWRDQLLARASVQKSTVDGIEDIFRAYLQGRGSEGRDASPSYLGTRLQAS